MTGKDQSGMQCAEVDLLLTEALDGQLQGERRERFEAHQAECPACKALFEDARSGLALLNEVGDVEPPRQLVHNILALTSRATASAEAAMAAALSQQDPARFFTAARRALQEGLAAQWHVPVSRVTIPEIRARLNGHAEGVRAVFQTADEIAYSGRRFSAPDLQQWRDLVKAQLHQLAQ